MKRIALELNLVAESNVVRVRTHYLCAGAQGSRGRVSGGGGTLLALQHRIHKVFLAESFYLVKTT